MIGATVRQLELDSSSLTHPESPGTPNQSMVANVMTHSFGASSFGRHTPGQPALVREQSTIPVPTTMHWTAPLAPTRRRRRG